MERITGMWLPGELAFNKELNATDKLVWFLINALDGKDNCFASRAYFAEQLNITEVSVTSAFTKLKRLEYIEELGFNGRTKKWKVNNNYIKKYKHLVDEWNEKIRTRILYRSNKEVFRSENKSSLGQQKRSLYPYNKKDINNNINNNNSFSSKEEKYSADAECKVSKEISETNESINQKTKSKKKTNLQNSSNTKPNKRKLIKNNNPYDDKVYHLFNYWNEQNIIRHKSNTKTYQKGLQALSKALLDNTYRDIKRSMETYKHFLNSNPTRMQKSRLGKSPYKVNLPEFCEFSKDTLINMSSADKTILGNHKSWLCECIDLSNHELKEKYTYQAKSKNPAVEKAIRRAWWEYLDKWATDQSAKLKHLKTTEGKNQIIKIAEFYLEFYKKYKPYRDKRIKEGVEVANVYHWARYLQEEKTDTEKLYYYMREEFWMQEFPAYCRDVIGVL